MAGDPWISTLRDCSHYGCTLHSQGSILLCKGIPGQIRLLWLPLYLQCIVRIMLLKRGQMSLPPGKPEGLWVLLDWQSPWLELGGYPSASWYPPTFMRNPSDCGPCSLPSPSKFSNINTGGRNGIHPEQTAWGLTSDRCGFGISSLCSTMIGCHCCWGNWVGWLWNWLFSWTGCLLEGSCMTNVSGKWW